jgi:hypothetical protein
MAEFKIPGGKSKGQTLAEASTADITFWAKKKKESLDAEPNGQYAGSNRAWLAAARAELAKRNGGAGGGAPAQKPTTALATTPTADGSALVGAFSDAKKATEVLTAGKSQFHLVSPAMSVGGLPEGCEVYTAMVVVDPDTDCYSLPQSKYGLDRVALLKIAGAAGITWVASHRTDDRSHPHFCAWEAVGQYRQFDGTIVTIRGNVEIDAREGGAAWEEIVEKARKTNRDDGGASQLLELRKFLPRHCESKAMNRAIANMGIKRSYTREELAKPFLVARLAATGRSNDPELQREFAKMQFQHMLAGGNALFGAPVQAAPAMMAPPAISPPPLASAPALQGRAQQQEEDLSWLDGFDMETDGEEQKSEPKAASPGQEEKL